ncbi:MAG: UPF0758 domain-containing protein, partial [Eudoraea sp.]|nr:UPF0758 domain-containing protein [Eudoraea sp.]
MAIRNWAPDDKPREKLRNKGAAALSDAELIAILIGSGNREQSAVMLAQQIMASVDHNIRRLSSYTIYQLLQFKGIGEAKAVTILAAFELAGRCNNYSDKRKQRISDSTTAYKRLHPKLARLKHEEFWILFLNNANHVIQESQISKGGITGTLVDVRLLLKKALEVGAVALILGHNHPS